MTILVLLTFAAAALLFLAGVIALGGILANVLRRVGSMPAPARLELEAAPAPPAPSGFAAFSRRVDRR